MAAALTSAASYPPMVFSSVKCSATASITGRGASAAPALLKCATLAQPGVSARSAPISLSRLSPPPPPVPPRLPAPFPVPSPTAPPFLPRVLSYPRATLAAGGS